MRAKMTACTILLSMMLVSLATGSLLRAFGDMVNGLANEAAAIVDPITKVATSAMFSQCNGIKQLIGVDYANVRDDRGLSLLTVNFFTYETRIKYKLSELATVISTKWFKPKEDVIIYIHGYTDHPEKESSQMLVSAFLNRGVGNVFVLDASSLIGFMYLHSSTMARHIGEELGRILTAMIHAGLNPSTIHLVGHSLGAHIAGFAGKSVLTLTGTRIGRISGLDPAGPCFSDVDKTLKLYKDDAVYVDVIHSDAGVLGLEEAIGHADFYPNQGSEQPGCPFQVVCSHDRARLYFTESVMNPKGFPAVSCPNWKSFERGNCNNNNWSFMGYGSKPGSEGVYYLQTADKPPFARGVKGVRYVGRNGFVRGFRGLFGL